MDNGARSYRRFLDGDESAFDSIMEELFCSTVFFVNGYVRDLHTAEDIAMDCFSDLIVHKHRYNFKVTLKTYIFMIARSRALDHIRHSKVIRFTELDDALDLSDDELSLEERVLCGERKRTVNSALGKLPRDMRIVVHLIYFEDMTYDEAAKVMRKKRKQIDNLLYRAKKELRIILGEDGERLL